MVASLISYNIYQIYIFSKNTPKLILVHNFWVKYTGWGWNFLATGRPAAAVGKTGIIWAAAAAGRDRLRSIKRCLKPTKRVRGVDSKGEKKVNREPGKLAEHVQWEWQYSSLRINCYIVATDRRKGRINHVFINTEKLYAGKLLLTGLVNTLKKGERERERQTNTIIVFYWHINNKYFIPADPKT